MPLPPSGPVLPSSAGSGFLDAPPGPSCSICRSSIPPGRARGSGEKSPLGRRGTGRRFHAPNGLSGLSVLGAGAGPGHCSLRGSAVRWWWPSHTGPGTRTVGRLATGSESSSWLGVLATGLPSHDSAPLWPTGSSSPSSRGHTWAHPIPSHSGCPHRCLQRPAGSTGPAWCPRTGTAQQAGVTIHHHRDAGSRAKHGRWAGLGCWWVSHVTS